MSFEITRRELFDALMSTSSASWNSRYQSADLFITNMLCIDSLSTTLKSELRKYYSKIKKEWEKCNRNKKRFMEKNLNWLDTIITVSIPGKDKSDPI